MSPPIEIAAFKAANARSYLQAVFDAWREGLVTSALPDRIGDTVPGTRILRTQSFEPDPGWFEADLPERSATDRALIAFSSGTTGQPKAILLSHGALADVVTRINDAMGVTPDIREYLGVPVTFSFGFGRARAVTEAGGRAYLPPNGFDPTEIGAMLARDEINAVSAVPTLWRVLLANPDVLPAGATKKLSWIEIGSQWMSGEEKLALRRLFPNAHIVQHYGLTEASRSTLLDISEAPEDRLESIGRATGAVEIAIGMEDCIRVRGPHLADGLVTEEGVQPITDPDGWLTTSDRGRIEDGWLYYGGRTDELINVGGLKIDPTAFEQSLNKALGRPGAVAAGRVTDPLRGEKILIAMPRDAALERQTVEAKARTVAADYGITGSGAFEFRDVAEIPVTATGKIRRADLADLPALESQTSTGHAAAASADGSLGELQALWADILGVDDVPLDKSFYDLGGDSLSALTAVLRMESLGIDTETARGIFDGKTIRELAGDTGASPDPEEVAPSGGLSLTQAINAVHATRGVLVYWVIIIHWLPGLMVRLGDTDLEFYRSLIPAWRFGTPGFAIVFGIGIGALRFQHYLTNRPLFLKNIRLNAAVVLGGVLLLGLVNFFNLVLTDRLDDTIALSGIFYSVITYYALALMVLPVLLWLLNLGSNRLLTIFVAAVTSMLIHELLFATFADARPGPVLEFLKLITTAKYGFFRMTGYVLLGVAIGWLFRQHHSAPGIARQLAGFGLACTALGALGLYQAAPEDLRGSFNVPYLWHLSIYTGVALLILAGFSVLNRKDQTLPWLQVPNAFLISSGILALPLFVGHELVSALKRLTDNLGLPPTISLTVLLGLFGLGVGFAYLRLMRMFLR